MGSAMCDSRRMGRTADLVLSAASLESVRRGHPWVWNKGVARGATGLATGAEVRLVSASGEAVGRGVFEADSPIAVRVWSLGEGDTPIDDAHIATKVEEAWQRRERYVGDGATTAYRLLNGEGDRTPGLVVDRYDTAAVVRLDGAAAEVTAARLRRGLIAALEGVGAKSIAVRRATQRGEPDLRGAGRRGAPATVAVQEHGVPFVVDLAHGQKTGAFLDQRENRRASARWRGAARAQPLLVRRRLLAPRGARRGDARDERRRRGGGARDGAGELPRRRASTRARTRSRPPTSSRSSTARAAAARRWDLVISDPPSFAPSEKARPRALSAYRALHRRVRGRPAPGRDSLRRLVLQPRRRRGVPLDARRRRPRRRDDLSLLELRGAPRTTRPSPAGPRGATSVAVLGLTSALRAPRTHWARSSRSRARCREGSKCCAEPRAGRTSPDAAALIRVRPASGRTPLVVAAGDRLEVEKPRGTSRRCCDAPRSHAGRRGTGGPPGRRRGRTSA